MSDFYITCPATGTRVSTGVKASEKLLSEPLATAATLMTCPACGNTHVWTPRGAIIIEDDQSMPPENAEAKKRAARGRSPKQKKKKRRNTKASHPSSDD